MPKLGFVIFCFSFFLNTCKIENNQDSQQVLYSYLIQVYMDTNYVSCPKRNFGNQVDFLDPKNDVKIGFLNSPPTNVSFQDLLGGKISNLSNSLVLELNTFFLPEVVNINFPPTNTQTSELFMGYTFSGNVDFSIGITHFSEGNPKPANWNYFNVLVFQNKSSSYGCGIPIKIQNTLKFQCDKNLIPLLKNLNEDSFFNVEINHLNEGNMSRDCY